MAKKYHITPTGEAKPCTAKQKPCKYGEHFNNFEEAQRRSDEIQEIVQNGKVEDRLELIKKGYCLDQFANSELWPIRYHVALAGYKPEKMINDPEWEVRRAVARQGYGLDKLADDDNVDVKCAVIDKNSNLEYLALDNNVIVSDHAISTLKELNGNDYSVKDMLKRLSVEGSEKEKLRLVDRGLELDTLMNDGDKEIRKVATRKIAISGTTDQKVKIAKECAFLEIMASDPSPEVRAAVAEQGYNLALFVNDPSWEVRNAVAKQGYGFGVLVNDSSKEVRKSCAKWLTKQLKNKWNEEEWEAIDNERFGIN